MALRQPFETLYDPCCTPACRSSMHARQLVALASRSNFSLAEFECASRCVCRCTHHKHVRDDVGRSLLHIAAVYNNVHLLRLLLEESVALAKLHDLESGWTPLHYAMFYGHFACAKYLIKAGAKLDAVDSNNINALQMCVYDSTRLLNEMVDDVPDVKSTNSNNDSEWTPSYLGWYDVNERRVDTVTWGQNGNFTLGLGTDHEKLIPDTSVAQAQGSQDEIIDVVMRKFHTLFVMRNGLVFGVGNGSGGRLGELKSSSAVLLRLSEIKIPTISRIVGVSAGRDHSVFLTQNGQVWTCGTNVHCQLGLSATLGTAESVTLPRLVHFPPSTIKASASSGGRSKLNLGTHAQQHIRLVKAERYHTVYASDSGVYVSGLNVGQFGPSVGGQLTKVAPASMASASQSHATAATQQFYSTPTELTCFTAAVADRSFPLKFIECSDAAMLLHAADDALFLLHNFKLKRLPGGPSQDAVPERLGVFGGRISAAGSSLDGAKPTELVVMALYNCEYSMLLARQNLGATSAEHSDGEIVVEGTVSKNIYTRAVDLPRSLRKNFNTTSYQSHPKLPVRPKTLPRAMADVAYRRELYCLKRVAPRQYQWRAVRLANVPHEHSYVKTFSVCHAKVIFADVYGQVFVAEFPVEQFALFHTGSSSKLLPNSQPNAASSSSNRVIPASSAQRFLTSRSDANAPLVAVATRVIHLQGVERVFCEPSGRNFAALRRLPTIEMRAECYTSQKGAMWQHRLCNERSLRKALQCLYEERDETGDYVVTWRDDEQQIECRVHGFVLFARSGALRQKYVLPLTDNIISCDVDEDDKENFIPEASGVEVNNRIELQCMLPPNEPAARQALLDDFIRYLYYARSPTKTIIDAGAVVDTTSKNARKRQLGDLCTAYHISKDWIGATETVKRGASFAHIGRDFTHACNFSPDSWVICEHDGGARLPCHRAMLIARSEYFSAMFMPGYWQEDAVPQSSFALSSSSSATTPMQKKQKMKTDFLLPCSRSVGRIFLRWIYSGNLLAYSDATDIERNGAVEAGENGHVETFAEERGDGGLFIDEPSSNKNNNLSKKARKKQQQEHAIHARAQLYVDVQDLCGLQSLADFILMPSLKRAVEPLLVLHIDLASVAALIKFAQQTNASLVYRYGHYFLARTIKFMLDTAAGGSDSLESLPDDVLQLVSQVYRDASCLRASADETHAVLQPILRRSDFRQVSPVDELDGVNYKQMVADARHWLSIKDTNNNNSLEQHQQEVFKLYAEIIPGIDDFTLSEAERRNIVSTWKSATKNVARRSNPAAVVENDTNINLLQDPAEPRLQRDEQFPQKLHADLLKTTPVVQSTPVTNATKNDGHQTAVNSTSSLTPVAPSKPKYLVKFEDLMRHEEERMRDLDGPLKNRAGDAPPLIIPKNMLSSVNVVDTNDAATATFSQQPAMRARPSGAWKIATPSSSFHNQQLLHAINNLVAPSPSVAASLSSIMEQEAAMKKRYDAAAVQKQLAQQAAVERMQPKTPPREILHTKSRGPPASPWAIVPSSPLQMSLSSVSPLNKSGGISSPKNHDQVLSAVEQQQKIKTQARLRPTLFADGDDNALTFSNAGLFSSSPALPTTVRFNTIQENELTAIDAAQRQRRQAFALVEIEERAIQELRAFYNTEHCAEEYIMVSRARPCVVPAQPQWK